MRKVDVAEKMIRKAEYEAKAAAEQLATFSASINADVDSQDHSFTRENQRKVNALVEASELAAKNLSETVFRSTQIAQTAERNGVLARAVLCRVKRDLQGSLSSSKLLVILGNLLFSQFTRFLPKVGRCSFEAACK